MLIPGGMFHPAGTSGVAGSGSGPGSMGPPPNRLPARYLVSSACCAEQVSAWKNLGGSHIEAAGYHMEAAESGALQRSSTVGLQAPAPCVLHT
jgi:hypothetical protein